MLEVDTPALLKDRLQSELEGVRKELADAKPRVITSGAAVANGVARFKVLDPADLSRAMDIVRKYIKPAFAGFGASSSEEFIAASTPDGAIELRMTKSGLEAMERDAIGRSIEVIRRRVDAMGTSEVSIVRQGANRIVVEAPGTSDPEELKRRIGKTAKMTFHLVDSSVSPEDAAAGRAPPGSEILPSDDPREPFVAIKSRVEISGDDLKDARGEYNQQTGEPIVTFQFNQKGALTFCRLTRQYSGQRFATVLDGRVITAPTINEPICGGGGYIHGNFTIESATELGQLLKAGALPAPLTVVEQRSVGAELGKDAIDAGSTAGIVATVGVIIFMVLAYGLFGAMACGALVINVLMILAAMSMVGATLSLPGIAGLILTIGMAVDANVLIYERMREEQANGRGPAIALDAGFNRAVVTILDSHVTQLGAALILFQFGHGPVRGFAWTLSIGVITSVFTAVLTTQLFVHWWFRLVRPKKLPI
jgi:protein-export membrane protein SecD